MIGFVELQHVLSLVDATYEEEKRKLAERTRMIDSQRSKVRDDVIMMSSEGRRRGKRERKENGKRSAGRGRFHSRRHDDVITLFPLFSRLVSGFFGFGISIVLESI